MVPRIELDWPAGPPPATATAPNPDFVNKYGLVEDGRSAETIVRDYYNGLAENVAAGRTVTIGMSRGSRAYGMPQIELATHLIEVMDREAENAKQPLDVRMRNHMVTMQHELRVVEHLLRTQRDVRDWLKRQETPPTVEDYRVLEDQVQQASGALEMVLLQLGNWTGRGEYHEQEATAAHEAWAKRLEIVNHHINKVDWQPINSAPVDAWVLIKSEVSKPEIVRYTGETLFSGDTIIATYEKTWMTLSGKPSRTGCEATHWMPIEQPTFDTEGQPHFANL